MKKTHSIFFLAILCFTVLLSSCSKEHGPNPVEPVEPPGAPAKRILLKDITIPHLPSPYYHFEYNTDSVPTKVDFGSGYTIYDVLYKGDTISEMRNNIIVNHDTLRYFYDNAGKLTQIKFINDANVIYRNVRFSYNGSRVKEINWDRRIGNTFSVDRTLRFTYYSDGNVKTITDYRPSLNGVPENTIITTFERYDDKINVDDFSLIHDGIHDHLFLLQGFRLQKNNPKKEIVTVNGSNFYTNDYTYIYNSDGTPSTKTGDFLYTGGSDAGKRFVTNSIYSYY